MQSWLFLVASICAASLVCVSCGYSEKTMTGRITDYDTGEPIQNAEVITGRVGWGFNDNGVLIWHKGYAQRVMTEMDGSFRVTAEVGNPATFRVNKEDYAYYLGNHDPDQPVQIRLKPINPDDTLLRIDMMQVGYEQGRPYGWIFSRKRTTFDPAEADIMPAPQVDFESNIITLTTPVGGGIQSLSVQDLGVQSDFLVYADMAPETGYSSEVALKIASGAPGDARVYFVRTHGGDHYAKFLFNPAAFSSQKKQTKTWDVLFESVYNPEGSHRLIYRK